MPEELETVLRLVADGLLTPEQASPIIEALTRAERSAGPGPERAHGRGDLRAERANDRFENASARGGSRGRQLRIRVTEHGRQAVNLRIPVGFVDAALNFVPGIGGDQGDRIREAVRAGAIGPIVDVEDPDGDGVLISVE
ncbi:MAG: hypothetical protein LC798_05895 [Chloroflexi bacterium]|nr:hypothetical protein [Chloroflexota bacterium]